MSTVLNELLDTLRESLGPEYLGENVTVNYEEVPEGFPDAPQVIGEFTGSQTEFQQKKLGKLARKECEEILGKKEMLTIF